MNFQSAMGLFFRNGGSNFFAGDTEPETMRETVNSEQLIFSVLQLTEVWLTAVNSFKVVTNS
jgi:hypothetical protein